MHCDMGGPVMSLCVCFDGDRQMKDGTLAGV